MKNYLSVAREWRGVKDSIQAHYERLKPMIAQIIEDHTKLSGQRIGSTHLTSGLPEKLSFYPFWGGWAFKFHHGWWDCPSPQNHWEITISQAREIEDFLASLQGEEEVKLLFRKWTEVRPLTY